MSEFIVKFESVTVKMENDKVTITINIPDLKKVKPITNRKDREELERLVLSNVNFKTWLESQIKKVLVGSGEEIEIANENYPMRSFGAGVLPVVKFEKGKYIIFNIRGSNRGAVWPLGTRMANVFCWKEFAGVTGTPNELIDPTLTARKELYEELTFTSGKGVLMPDDIDKFPDALLQLETNCERANKHNGFGLYLLHGGYKIDKLSSGKNSNITVIINDSEKKEKNKFEGNVIVNYDPFTNSLELTFVTLVELKREISGILSLAGRENDDTSLKPYFEDIILISEENLRKAKIGEEIGVHHLLSSHGPYNYLTVSKMPDSILSYLPSPTVRPIIDNFFDRYCFKEILQRALEKLEKI